MKPAPFDYARPAGLDEAARLLAEAGGGASVIAGGQTLMPLLNLRMSQPFLLVDLGAIPELRTVERHTGGLRVGAMAVQNELLGHPLVRSDLPLLARALGHVGHHQTRNRGTIGGSIAFAELAAECPAVALALDAQVRLHSVRGTRQVAMADFLHGPYATACAFDEIVTALVFPDPPPGERVEVFFEVARRPGDFALTGFAGELHLDGGTIAAARLAWFAMGPTALRAREAEAALVGTALDEIDPEAIAELALAGTAPFDDKAASAAYRETVARRMFARTLRETCAGRAMA